MAELQKRRLNDPNLIMLSFELGDDGHYRMLVKSEGGAATDTTGIGTPASAESVSGNGDTVGLLKRVRTLLDGTAVTETTWTITAGQSLSNAVDVSRQSLYCLLMPATWDSNASLTFQVSLDNATYRDVYLEDGTEYTVVASASRAIMLDPAILMSARYIKIRSGTSTSPIVQSGTRSIVGQTRNM